MKKRSSLLSIVVLISFLLSSCGESLTPKTSEDSTSSDSSDILYLNLLWHQHQPLYYKDENGVYTRPWVRVHATKDYYDMAATLSKYPNVHVTFNLTPVLIEQLNDFVNNGAKDQYWVLSEKNAAELTEEEKTFILVRFFDANWDHMIRVHPGYKRLLDLRGELIDDDVSLAKDKFTEQDYRDLQVWFNLAWIDPDELAKAPLASLILKDHQFNEEDKSVLFDEIIRIIAEVLPIHKELQAKNQIEVITTPLAHPILPLIYNSNEASIGNPQAELPKQYSYVQDAITHLKTSVDIYTETYGMPPKGLWPGEGAVSEDIVPIVGNAGYTWMASGEQVLASSLGIGSFTRDSFDTVQEADQLYRPYFVHGAEDGPIQGPKVMMVFRDTLLSDKLGFTYSQTPGKVAAQDFMQRLENIRQRLQGEGAEGPHLVSVILDGENAWENYDNDGKEFLNALYEELSNSKTVRTVTPSEYLASFPEQRELGKLFSGAWFSANYDTWIGEVEENTAWNYLGRTRSFLTDFEQGKKQAPSQQDLEQAFRYMYFAEGSDWFWWYGSDQDSGNDSYFDLGFRQLLAKVYESLGEPVPSFVKVPIIPKSVAEINQGVLGNFTPIIDGLAEEGEWTKAAYSQFSGGAQARSEDVASGFYYGVDAKNLYLRIDAKSDWNGLVGGGVGVYFSSPKGKSTSAISLRSIDSSDPYLLGFSATNLVEVDVSTNISKYFLGTSSKWIESPEKIVSAVNGPVLEIALPLSALGDVQAGDEIKLVSVVSQNDRDLQSLPAEGPGQLILPDLGNIEYILDITDPQGDDHGPGSYTYPTDTVFEPSVLDITSFKVGVGDTDMVFKFTIAGQLKNPWNSGSNLSVQTFDVYIDKDPGAGTGARLLLPGRNCSLLDSDGWEYAIWAEGWTPGIFAPDPVTTEAKSVSGASVKIIVDTAKSTVTLRVPRSVFGEGDPKTWGYAAALLSQEGFPSPGIWRVRDVQANAEQWRIGGGSDTATNQTRIMDLVWAESNPTQEEMLSDYQLSEADVDTLSADDFAQIKLIKINP